MLCPHPHLFGDQGSRDAVQTGAALATVELGVAGDRGLPGFLWGDRRRTPHLGCSRTTLEGNQSFLLPGLSRVLLCPLLAMLVALGHLLCPEPAGRLQHGGPEFWLLCMALGWEHMLKPFQRESERCFLPFQSSHLEIQTQVSIVFPFLSSPSTLRACVGLSMLCFKF